MSVFGKQQSQPPQMGAGGAPPAAPPRPFAVAAGGQPPPPPGYAPAGQGQVVVQLSQPLQTHKGPITQILLNKPVGGDYCDFGDIDVVYALDIDEATKQPTRYQHTMNREALMDYMVRLSGIERTILRTLSGADFGKLAMVVRRLVMEFTNSGNSPSPPA